VTLNRRTVIGMIGVATATLAVGCRPGQSGPGWLARRRGPSGIATPPCIVRPEQTEGPYFVDERLNRSDLRSDPSDGSVKEGTALHLAIRVHEIRGNACLPLAGAMVDVWHCDALGVYSDVRDRSFDTRGKKFLRGYQLTDGEGAARFTTLYPGWYRGRTVHIHFKIRTHPEARRGFEFTSQCYFDEALTDRVHAQAPYAAKGYRTLKNADDPIFLDGGDQLMLHLAPAEQGFAGAFDIGLEMT